MDTSKFSVASLFAAYTSLTAILTLIRQFYNQFVPELVRSYISSKLKQWFDKPLYRKNSFTLVIDEYDRDTYQQNTNLLYQACQVYLSNKLRSKATRLKGIRKKSDQPTVTYLLAHGESFIETLEDEGVDLMWKFSSKNNKGEDVDYGQSRCFELTFDLAYKNKVLDGYIPLVVLTYYDRMMEMKKEIYLYTHEGYNAWQSVKFNHPFTFDSLALDPELKQAIIEDLDMFIKRKEFYNKVGKAWKRGYLLYGPPGTGKSSLVAAMANYLRFSIYDLQLGCVSSDAVLRKLMLSITNKSILVIEDIDCTIGLSRATPKTSDYHHDGDYDNNNGDDIFDNDYDNKGNRMGNFNGESKLSLSGLLNFIDGLWSSCGDERIIIFTTNHKERLDPAMLRPGRMDMHIHMSYLTMKGFKVLANNYLGVSGEHPLFLEIEPLLESTQVTPAQVAEELIRNEDVDIALSRVVEMMKKRCKPCQKLKKGATTRASDSIKGKKDGNDLGNIKEMNKIQQED